MSDPDRSTAPQRPQWWLATLAAGFPAAVGLDMTLRLYQHNAAELLGGTQALWETASVWLGVWMVLFAALRWGRGPGKLLWLLVCSYTVFFLVRDIAFPQRFAELDGLPVRRPGLRYGVLELVTLCLATAGVLLLRTQRALPVAAIGGGVFGLSAVLVAVAPTSTPNAELEPAPSRAPRATNQPDVFHILFDSWQAVEYQFARRQHGPQPFEDFTVFSDVLCNYNYTVFSMPSFLTAKLYQPGTSYGAYKNSYLHNGLFRTFHQAGFQVEVSGYFLFTSQTPYAHMRRCSQHLAAELRRQLGSPPSFGGDLLPLVRLRTLPARIAASWPALEDDRLPPSEAHGYYAARMFRDMVAGLKDAPAGNTYRFLHIILPHHPNTADAEGNYVGIGDASRYEQVLLVENLMRELIAELKRLDRYDRSVLLVHSDHGNWTDPDLDRQCLAPMRDNGREPLAMNELPGHRAFLVSQEIRDPCQWPLPFVQSRSRPVLLLKAVGQRGQQVCTAPAQLSDIPRTLLGQLGLPADVEEYPDGVDLLAKPPTAERIRKVHFVGACGRHSQAQEYIVERGQFRRGAVIPMTE